MNNGQTNPSNQPPVPPDFFTVGADSNNPEVSDSTGNNLDTSGIGWSPQADHDTQRVGRSALHENGPFQSPDNNAESIKFEMPPDYVEPVVQESISKEESTQSQPQPDSNIDQPDTINFDKIKTSDTLSPSSIREIDKAEKKLEQDGKMGDFYKMARQMTEANVNNSYGDKANWKGNQ
ncbi:MAG: hypothetical protein Q4A70_02920 [Candidatus Saccharibacteria bacterium]|nr:hypothetical protein [Candidatus Saccharibacteria bacterium]